MARNRSPWLHYDRDYHRARKAMLWDRRLTITRVFIGIAGLVVVAGLVLIAELR